MLTKFKNLHEGEIGLIIGNGPSLSECPRELLDKYITFGANKIYMLQDWQRYTNLRVDISDEVKESLKKFDGFVPNYYTIIDEHMLHNCGLGLANGAYKPEAMFIRRPYPIKGCYHINTIVAAGWSNNINKAVVMGGTVTYASLQIAFYMGIRTVLLVGVDHKYPSFEGAPQGFIFQMEGPDPAHWHPGYFKEGDFYAAPALEGSHEYYKLARMVFDQEKGQIINLTPETGETAFEKGSYDDWY
jgi:hypothetical protein